MSEKLFDEENKLYNRILNLGKIGNSANLSDEESNIIKTIVLEDIFSLRLKLQSVINNIDHIQRALEKINLTKVSDINE
jgi:hypothetical protein